MVPSPLYKYATAETTLAVLSNRSLRWSSPKLFNDILEFKRLPSFDTGALAAIPEYMALVIRAAAGEVTLEETRLTPGTKQLLAGFRSLVANGTTVQQMIDVLPSGLDKGDLELNDRVLDFIDADGARVLCLTETPTNDAMWGNYAKDATGCVLGLRALDDSAWAAARQITYYDVLPPLGSGLDLHLYGHTKEMLEKTIEGICYSKKAVWSYEKEWRMVTWMRPGETGLTSYYPFDADELESVTFGARVLPETEQSVRALVRASYPRCDLHRIVIRNGEAIRIPADAT